jgi:phosphatidylcholine synthase
MAYTIVIDAIDGTLARAVRVKEVIPWIDGSRLDDVVDYFTYVLVPAFFLVQMNLLPAGWALPVVALMVIASGYGFSQTTAKTADHFFTGFPSYWNIVALYLYIFAVPAGASAATLIVLSVLVFVRIGYIYPSRTPVLRRLTVAFGSAWAASVAALIAWLPSPPRSLAIASLAFPVYYIVLSLVLHVRRRPVSAE